MNKAVRRKVVFRAFFHVLLAIALGASVFGVLEGWSAGNALWFTFDTMSTIGYMLSPSVFLVPLVLSLLSCLSCLVSLVSLVFVSVSVSVCCLYLACVFCEVWHVDSVQP